MKTTPRFDSAVSKLYNAFHEKRLIGNDCTACAVGNMCDNSGSWFGAVDSARPELNMNYIKITKLPLMKNVVDNETIIKTGYSGNQLAMIETLFLSEIDIVENEETQFKGLCKVVEYLCELDNIPNIMDYTRLFETENNQPKYQLA